MIDINKYIDLAQNSIDDAEKYRMTEAPTSVFKFLPLYDRGNPEINSRNIETIEENCIWASKYSSLNDPFEFKSIYLDEKKIIESGNTLEVVEKYVENINNSFLVISFSSVGNDIHPLNNMPMWAYYANNHHGICIEYEVVSPIVLYPAIYEAGRHKIASIIANFIHLAAQAVEGKIPPNDAELLKYQFIIINALCRKHKAWRHENEYRILYPNIDKVSFGKRILLNETGVRAKAIYLGKNCSNRNNRKLYSVSKKLGIEIFKMDINNNSDDFEMIYSPYMI